MAPHRQDWARVEWEFLRFDARFGKLPDDQARVTYLRLWVTCVHLRRSIFERSEISGPFLADVVGVSRELLLSNIESSLAVGLCARGPRGAVTICGVESRHPTLRGWNEQKTRLDCCSIDCLKEREKGIEIERGKAGSPEPPQAAASEPVCAAPYEGIQEAWNSVAAKAGCVACRDLTPSRKQKIRTRCRDAHWRDHWLAAITLLPERKFACGENDRGWRMDFDFFLRPDTVTGLMEGKYAGGPGKKPASAQTGVPPPPRWAGTERPKED